MSNNNELNSIPEIDGNKIKLDDLNTDENVKPAEAVKGLKKITPADSELTKQAKTLYNQELKFQAGQNSLLRNYLKLDGYKALIYLSKMHCGDSHFDDLKNKIIGWDTPNQVNADGIQDRKEFRQMQEVKDFLKFLEKILTVYKEKKRYAMQKLVKVLRENIYYHEWTQGSFRSARFTAGQLAKAKKQGNIPGADEDEDDVV